MRLHVFTKVERRTTCPALRQEYLSEDPQRPLINLGA